MVSFACLFHQSRSFLFSRDKYICQEILIKPQPNRVHSGAKPSTLSVKPTASLFQHCAEVQQVHNEG